MEKKEYMAPEVEIIEINTESFIAGSGTGNEAGGDGEDEDLGDWGMGS